MPDDPPSKSQRKRDMHELQDLGAQLVELSDQQLASVELPDRLRDAVMDARRVTRFEARRRQFQYIGKIMRTVDPAPIRDKLESWKAASLTQTRRLHLLEEWRDRLIADESALGEFVTHYPDADAARLRALVASVHREREAGRPPKSFRALFRLLNEVIPDRAAASSGESAEPAHRDRG